MMKMKKEQINALFQSLIAFGTKYYNGQIKGAQATFPEDIWKHMVDDVTNACKTATRETERETLCVNLFMELYMLVSRRGKGTPAAEDFRKTKDFLALRRIYELISQFEADKRGTNDISLWDDWNRSQLKARAEENNPFFDMLCLAYTKGLAAA